MVDVGGYMWEADWSPHQNGSYRPSPVVHIIACIEKGETPADSKCEEYKAACGVSGQSWAMPAQGIKATSTHAFRYPEGKTLCPTCFPSFASRV
jgi:hypothetical protein